MRQFGRKYRVTVVSGTTGIDVSDMRCKFSIKKQWAGQPNMSTLTIYNLSANTENAIVQSADSIRIEVGYENGQFGEIFSGNIIQFVRGKEDSTDFYLTLLSLDGDNFFNFGTVAFSLNRGMGLRQQTEQIVSNSNIPATIGDITGTDDSQKLSRGKVYFGAAKDYLRDIGKTANSIFSIDSGAVTVQKLTGTPAGQAIILNSDTGLVGFPMQNDLGVTCKCLINPQIVTGGLIQLNNSTINQKEISLGQFLRPLSADGVYRVISLNHTGDTRGQEWYTEITAIAQGESLIPGLMPGLNSNGM